MEVLTNPELINQALIARAQAGDEAALTTIIEAIAPAVSRQTARFFISSPQGIKEVAQDAAQEALWLIAQNITRYSPTGSFSAWFHTITNNVCISALRAQAAQTKRDRFDPTVVASQASPFDHPTLEALVIKRLEQPRINTILQAGLAKLLPHYRQALIARDVQELDIGQVRARVGLSSDLATRMVLTKARRALRQFVSQQAPDLVATSYR